MKICWKALGFSEILDLGTEQGYRTFVDDVVQDPDKATEILAKLQHHGEAIVDEHDPVEFEYYIRLNDAPVYSLTTAL